MKLIIEIDLDNAAFKTERGLDGAEILSTVQNVGLKPLITFIATNRLRSLSKIRTATPSGFVSCERRQPLKTTTPSSFWNPSVTIRKGDVVCCKDL